MFKKLLLTVLMILVGGFGLGLAQDATVTEATETQSPDVEWKKDLKVRFQLNQIYFDNWTKGGENTYTWLVNIDNNFTRTSKVFKWDNIYRFRYGRSKTGDNITIVTDNEIDLRSDLILEKREHVNVFLGTALKTQAATGYNYDNNTRDPRSGFLDPVFLTQKLGLDFNYVKNLKLRVSFDIGEKYADDYLEFYGIDDPMTTKVEKMKVSRAVGVYARYNRNFGERVSMDSVVEIDNNLAFYKDTVVNWRNVVDIKLIKNVSLTLDTIFRFDRSQSKSGQFKHITGFSVVYSFFDPTQ